jgi:hypothetical protein
MGDEKSDMSESTRFPMPLWLACFVLCTIVPLGGYVGMKIWFYMLNARFRKNSVGIRDLLAKEATFSRGNNRRVFVGFFHPYWCSPSYKMLTAATQGGEVSEFCGLLSRQFRRSSQT